MGKPTEGSLSETQTEKPSFLVCWWTEFFDAGKMKKKMSM